MGQPSEQPRNQSILAKVIASVASVFLVAIGVYAIKNKEDNKTEEGTTPEQLPVSNTVETQEAINDESAGEVEETEDVVESLPASPTTVSPTPATPPASTAPQNPAPSKSSSPSKSTKTS